MPAPAARFNDRSVTAALRLLLALLALIAVGAAHAQTFGTGPLTVPATLEAETVRPAAGSTATLALAFRPQPGWHGYWTNPGEAGLPMRLDWTLPAGVWVGEPRLPVPDLLLISGLANHVFEHDYAALINLRLPGGLRPGTELPVSVSANWLACTDEICVPQSDTLSLLLTVGDGRIEAGERARFDGWRAALPRPLGSSATYQVTGNEISVAVPLPADVALEGPHLFAFETSALDSAAAQTVRRTEDRLIVTTRLGSAGEPSQLDAVLRLGPGRGLAVTARPGAVPAGGQLVGAAAQPSAWLAFLLAVAGGLVLNVLPCVFPILSLKALALARGGGEGARVEAVAYTGGTVAVSLALGAVLLLLRAGGAQVGWAFQLQDPRTLAVLFLVVTAIAANLAGLFELPTVVGGRLETRGVGSAFATGALAAFVATPCTGPFMAAALGAALVLPPVAAMAVFGGLGLGLALPFLALGFVPALRRRLPKPGPWMVRLRHWLAVPMALTALALAWVVWRQAGWPGLALIGVGGALVLLILAMVGGRQRGGRSALAPALCALAIGAGLALALPAVARPPATGVSAALGAEAYSDARFAALRASGRPVFVYFTADWCLTCKVNEATAIDTAAVRRAFEAKNVAVLEGDWTDGDPALGRAIERHGRAGVPLYLWAAPGEPVRVLPQVLTSGGLVALTR